jgi:hypothetical protein
MSQLDLLILVVYTITVIIVMIRAIESLDQKTKVDFNDTRFQERLKQYELDSKLKVKFKFEDRYSINEQPSKLAITIENKSNDAIYVDWDRSTIADLEGRSRRAIRLTPYGSPDLSKAQVDTVVPPGSRVQETITAESCLAPDELNPEILNPSKPLLDINALQKAGIKSKEKKKLYEDFMDEKITLTFPLWLVFQFGELESSHRGDRLYVVPCDIVTRKMPWTDSLPWRPEKK